MQYSTPSFTATWKVLGASVPGTSHCKKGQGCDDSHAYRVFNYGIVLLVAADGAGSALQAAQGANYVVQKACAVVEKQVTQGTEPTNPEEWQAELSTILKEVRLGLEEYLFGRNTLEIPMPSSPTHSKDTDAVGMPPASNSTRHVASAEQSTQAAKKWILRDFATTLQLVIITPHSLGAVQVGDGAVVIQRANNEIEAVTWPDHGEYINQTSFITDADYLAQAQYRSMSSHDVQSVALFTDGLERLALELAEKKAYRPFFTPIFRFAADSNSTQEDLVAYLESAAICERTDDDKTLVLATLFRQQMQAIDPLNQNQ
jgi:serine/threonine protein phosphatase PrpC